MSSSITSGFIDLATVDEIEKYMYGLPDDGVSMAHTLTYFVREFKKSTWFTQVPVPLSRSTGTSDFGQNWSVSISRAGDYLLQTWLRVTIPQVTLAATATPATLSLRWTRNLMHNLIREITISFNDLVGSRLDNYFLDMWSAFTTPASKRNGYDNMIGNISTLTDPVGPGGSLGHTGGTVLNLPISLFFTRDTGVSLPTAALPYNEIQLNFSMRDWKDLLILTDTAITTGNPYQTIDVSKHLGGVAPSLSNVQVWANYAIVSNVERKKMGCGVRDILIEQVQTAPRQNYTPSTNPMPSFDIRFSHAVKVLFFAVRNKTSAAEWSNYGTSSPVVSGTSVNYEPSGSFDPIATTTLIYENSNRLGTMGSDYYSLVSPWYHAPTIPSFIGYHMYSYSLNFFDLDPMGSTNYGKLTNVSIVPHASDAAVKASTGAGDGAGANYNQSYEFIVMAVNNNIVRISGGCLGFPVL
ncbi:hypothetical protein MIV014L [Invertebrate iridescent virus 3]|uniref:Major capsid protein n=1 Tax=Invertebrate iridescent virus 3 TaxID=345201 RepID=MCP_IIV3|nr:hypothetical protein MIV014L [Invertebrate iridescent virus 3]Q197E6.1 RecName: Full=Major capsid protein; Short=MCP [Invertebrate iridescent virus 3]ABF82044.1 hypothetical protein MIV014L [Invertebrate iridescent virus 3]